MQEVPEAISWVADHTPEAQRWKDVPEMQFHAPSSLHEPLKAPELEELEEPELELELELEEGEAGIAAEVADGAAGSGADEADVEAGAGSAAWVDAGAVAAAAEVTTAEPESEEPDPELVPVAESPALAKVGVPVQAAAPTLAKLEASPRYWTTSPG